MCGRFYLDVDFAEVMKHYFGQVTTPVQAKAGEYFPTDQVPVVRMGSQGPKLTRMRWGFAPAYANRPLINARSETILTKKTFSEAFIHRRCLIPASGFYEWESLGDKKKAKRKVFVPGQEIVSFAAIYDRFQDKNGENFWGFSILTKAANVHLEKIHDRMPLILTKDQEKVWIGNHGQTLDPLLALIDAVDPLLAIEPVDDPGDKAGGDPSQEQLTLF